MKIKQGYVYHVKDEYFDVVNDSTLMRNHENGKARPTYFCVKNNDTNIKAKELIKKKRVTINDQIISKSDIKINQENRKKSLFSLP